ALGDDVVGRDRVVLDLERADERRLDGGGANLPDVLVGRRLPRPQREEHERRSPRRTGRGGHLLAEYGDEARRVRIADVVLRPVGAITVRVGGRHREYVGEQVRAVGSFGPGESEYAAALQFGDCLPL